MKIQIPIQELSDGRFRNGLTGKIGDSIDSVIKNLPTKDEKINFISEHITDESLDKIYRQLGGK